MYFSHRTSRWSHFLFHFHQYCLMENLKNKISFCAFDSHSKEWEISVWFYHNRMALIENTKESVSLKYLNLFLKSEEQGRDEAAKWNTYRKTCILHTVLANTCTIILDSSHQSPSFAIPMMKPVLKQHPLQASVYLKDSTTSQCPSNQREAI